MRTWLAAALLAPSLGFHLDAHAQSCSAGETPAAFAFTGSQQSLAVPAGVRSARVFLSGAQGGDGVSGQGNSGGIGGLGARVEGAIALTPGATLYVGVGGRGSLTVNPGGSGRAPDGIGGGGTDLRIGGNSVGDRVAIAGGGGGGGNAGWGGTTLPVLGGNGGAGGGGAGTAGSTVTGGAQAGPFGGAGGTLGLGGTGGAGCYRYPSTAGANSGNGGGSYNFAGSFAGAGFAGGGGGGATNGGGGGGAGVGTEGCLHNWNGGGGGGAGGSSDAGGLTSPVLASGVQSGDGSALICFAAPTFDVTGSASGQTGDVSLQLNSTSPATAQNIVVSAGATSFAFPTRLNGGSNWNIDILDMPDGQLCTVSPASGAGIAADTAVTLTCTTVTVSISPATLPDAVYGAAYSQTLTASSANGGAAPYTFSLLSGALPAGMSFNSAGVLSGTSAAAGSYNLTVRATSSNGFFGDRNYTLQVGKAAQAISNFAANPANPEFVAGGTFAVSAVGGASGNPVTFASSAPAVCSVSGSTVTMLGAGACAITADQAGDANYDAAPQATLTVPIGPGVQVISDFEANPANPVYALNGTFAISATGGPSGNLVVFASTSPAVCTVVGSTVTMRAAGTCALTADQAGGGSYQPAEQVALSVEIGRAAPALGWIAPLSKIVGQGGFDLPDPSSPSAGAFTFGSSDASVATVSGRHVTLVGRGQTTLTATQAAAGSYTAASIEVVLTVDDRPDPTQDPSVVGGLQAQVDASVRFAAAQQSNINDRLRQQRHATGNRSSNGLSLSFGSRSGAGLTLSANQLAPEAASTLELPQGWALWTAGTITSGDRDPRRGSEGFDFRSDGLTVGADWRIDERFLLGIAGGFGWNDTDFDGPRSKLEGEQRSLSMYGLWRADDHWFVDGTLGWGRLDFDIVRWSAIANAAAQAEREGDQAFGTLSAGYEHRGEGMSVTGYGRLDASRTRLDAYRERGLGIYDLSYGAQTIDNSGVSLGVDGSYPFVGRRGLVRPFWMVEYRKALNNRSDIELNYVVQPATSDYLLRMRSYGDHSLTYGGGLDMDLSRTWRLSMLLRRQHASDQEPGISFGLLLSYSPGMESGGANTAPSAAIDASSSASGERTGE